MKSPTTFVSASGLRPLSAFVVVGAVLVVVAGWLARVAVASDVAQPSRLVTDEVRPFPYAIADRDGRTLACFVPRFDLEMSPRSMWQAHTPEHMARVLSAALGGDPDPATLLDRMLPGAEDGVVSVDAWELTPRQANRVQMWIDSGAGGGRGKLQGIWVVADEAARPGRPPRYRLLWRPEVLLSAEVRHEHGYRSAWAWGRSLAAGLAAALGEEPKPGTPAAPLSEERREAIWDALLPVAFARPVTGLAPERALVVRDALDEEGVSPWQMRVAYGRDRDYPCGEDQLFGSWGYVHPHDAQPRPREGLELLCDRLLSREPWCDLPRADAEYTWLRDRTVRGTRANGYVSYRPASDPPVVRSTIDLALQRYVHRELLALQAEHEPAIAMAIAVDVQSGDVLAVDSVESYDVQPFAPLYHAFTPGSTVKIMTMALALESGVVRDPWTETVDVGNGAYAIPGCRRVVEEAEGALHGRNSLADFFAKSTNAAFVQLGLRIPSELHHEFLVRMGYGRAPHAGLGPESGGYLPPLPWSDCYTHASVSFGHEMTTTLWQHATAIADVLRGGIARPLRLVSTVETGGEEHPVPLDPGTRVLSAETCSTIRDLMHHGAEWGTGRKVYRDDIAMGTKTGTAQKVPGELCLHVELEARHEWAEKGIKPTRALLRSLKSRKKPHSRCYTSSMCAFGSRDEADGGDGREVMVLVVADEPLGKKKFGSDVAGPTTVSILVEALGITRDGVEPDDESYHGFAFEPGTAPGAVLADGADPGRGRSSW